MLNVSYSSSCFFIKKIDRIFFISVIFLMIFLLFSVLENRNTVYAADSEEQDISVDLISHNDGYSAVLYDNTNGLPTPEANAIVNTKEGFIWIGSYDGLIRYDGNTFERIDSTTGIASVVCLYVDSKDRLWIGTSDNGVFLMEKGEFRQWNKSEGMESSYIRSISEDGNGLIYVGTTRGIGTINNEMKWNMISSPYFTDDYQYMRNIQVGQDGLIYALTNDGDVFTIRSGNVENYFSQDQIGVDNIVSIFPDTVSPGFVYLGTADSELYYGSIEDVLSKLTQTDISPLASVNEFEYFDEKLWICAENGIGILSENGFEVLENLPMTGSIGNAMTDYEGNLWFTSTRQGVMKIVRNQFSDIYKRFGLDKAVVNSTCAIDDLLYIGTDSGITVLNSDGVVSSVPLKKAQTGSGEKVEADDLLKYLDGCRIRSLIRDSKNRLWISTWRKHGLLCLDNGELTEYTEKEGLLSDRIRTVYEREDGSFLVALTGGVNVIKDGKVIESYGTEKGIINTETLTVAEGDNGDILVGSNGDGIYIPNKKSGLKHIGTEDGLMSDVILRIKPDKLRNLYWIITSNSIAYMTSDYKVTTINRFPYSNNFDIFENSRGEIWILSSNGIYILPVEELLANSDISPVHYGMDNGIPCVSTANSYSELTSDGDLYISGTTGVARVNIEKPLDNVNSLKAAIPYIEVDGKRVYPDKTGVFTISSNVKKLTVYSYVYNYSLMTPKISYRLQGFEDTITTVSRSDLQPVDYTNLSGGEYQFVLQIRDSRGFGDKTISVKIIKEKAFYEMLWFYVVIAILIILLIIMIVRMYIRWRVEKLEKKHQENMTFVREITEAFAKVIDMKDKYTNGHSLRVAKYTAMLCKELGYNDEDTEKYYYIALLHDIGKIGIPSEVLNKAGKLTDEEFEIIKSHAAMGYEALKGINIMPELALGAQAHHERPDGKGYPNHLKEGEIPRAAQIIAVADCFDAMYSNRPYRDRMNFDKVVNIIKCSAGTQLSRDVVEAFLRLVKRGEFRDPDDHGGGTTENIDNIRKNS